MEIQRQDVKNLLYTRRLLNCYKALTHAVAYSKTAWEAEPIPVSRQLANHKPSSMLPYQYFPVGLPLQFLGVGPQSSSPLYYYYRVLRASLFVCQPVDGSLICFM